jgi:hypothetical protein
MTTIGDDLSGRPDWSQLLDRALSTGIPVYPASAQAWGEARWPDEGETDSYFSLMETLQPPVIYVTEDEIGFVVGVIYHCLHREIEPELSDLAETGRMERRETRSAKQQEMGSLKDRWVAALCEDSGFIRANTSSDAASAALPDLAEALSSDRALIDADGTTTARWAAYSAITTARHRVYKEVRPARIREAEERIAELAIELSNQPSFRECRCVEERERQARLLLEERFDIRPRALVATLAHRAKERQ